MLLWESERCTGKKEYDCYCFLLDSDCTRTSRGLSLPGNIINTHDKQHLWYYNSYNIKGFTSSSKQLSWVSNNNTFNLLK